MMEVSRFPPLRNTDYGKPSTLAQVQGKKRNAPTRPGALKDSRDNQPRLQKLKTTIRRHVRKAGLFLLEVTQTSSLHGINHFVLPKRHILERLFWVLMEILASMAVVYIVLNILYRYETSPTVISIERDYLSWNTTFPAATICLREINITKLEDIVNEYEESERDSVREFLKQLASIHLGSELGEDLWDHKLVPPEQYHNMLARMQVDFIPQVLTSLTQAIPLHRTITEMGLCYALNSKLAIYNSIEYWNQNNWTQLHQNEIAAHQLEGEIYIQLSSFNLSYDMYLHGPSEMPQLSDRGFPGPILSFRSIILRVLSIYSSPAVRSLHFKQRQCRYLDERILKRSPVYSFNLCLVECRAAKILKICGCVPHLYRRLANEKVCSVTDLRCVGYYRENLAQKTTAASCHCAQACDGDFFSVRDDEFMIWGRWTHIKFGIKDYPKMRLKRDVLYGFTDVLVNCGGAVGLMLGGSVLTVVEFAYFLTLRLFWFLKNTAVH